jgi:hypothetical protein
MSSSFESEYPLLLERVLYRILGYRNHYRNDKKNAYETCLYDDPAVAPFFTRISESLLNCGLNVEFLWKLNKMQCVTAEILKDGKNFETIEFRLNIVEGIIKYCTYSFCVGTLIDSIIREFLLRSSQHQRTNVDASDANFTSEALDDVNVVIENDEMFEECLSNSYLMQAYSDFLKPDDVMRMTLGQSRYAYSFGEGL